MTNRKLTSTAKELKNTPWVQMLFAEKANIFIVGGYVRDAFLSIESKDLDIVVENLPIEKIKEILQPYGDVKVCGESFKVLKFKPKGWEGEPIDIATPRKDIKVGTGHKGFETIAVDRIDEDLKRRDFTINSIAFDVELNSILDPFLGLEDMQDETIRATDVNAFIEDPLRMMRAVQFAARFGFRIEEKTKNLMKKNANLLKEISGERILEEFQKILKKKGDPFLALRLMKETNLDLALFGKGFGKIVEFDLTSVISFYYYIATLAGVDPATFYKKVLKGNSPTENGLKTLTNLVSNWNHTDVETQRCDVLNAVEKSPLILEIDHELVPNELGWTLHLMAINAIPTTTADLAFNGYDVIKAVNQSGKIVGEYMAKMKKAALMEVYDWKDREACLNYFEKLLLNNNKNG